MGERRRRRQDRQQTSSSAAQPKPTAGEMDGGSGLNDHDDEKE